MPFSFLIDASFFQEEENDDEDEDARQQDSPISRRLAAERAGQLPPLMPPLPPAPARSTCPPRARELPADYEDEVGEVSEVEDAANADTRAEADAARRIALEAELEANEREADRLQQNHKKLARDAEQVSDETYAEAKRLLSLFGVPYIEAPMEAEAQCAQLEQADLVDAIATEDNDAFLFGGRCVYKHLFDQKHHVEVYSMDDIEAELHVSRRELVALAQLLGSDYTDGVHGVGVVNAMETIAAYGASESGLVTFGKWVRAWRGDGEEGEEGAAEPPPDDEEDEMEPNEAGDAGEASGSAAGVLAQRRARRLAFEKRHRTVRRNWVLPDTFPSSAVADAYLRPHVDNSEAPCQWSRPDLRALREFCLDKFGWTQAKADELLLPMMAEYEKGLTQSRIDQHFSFERRFARVDSTRLATAIGIQTGSRELAVPLSYAAGLAVKSGGAAVKSGAAGGRGAGHRSKGAGRGRGARGGARKLAGPKSKAPAVKKPRRKRKGAQSDDSDEEDAADEGDEGDEEASFEGGTDTGTLPGTAELHYWDGTATAAAAVAAPSLTVPTVRPQKLSAVVATSTPVATPATTSVTTSVTTSAIPSTTALPAAAAAAAVPKPRSQRAASSATTAASMEAEAAAAAWNKASERAAAAAARAREMAAKAAEAQAVLESIETAKRAKRAEEAAVEEAAKAKATAEAAQAAASERALRTHDVQMHEEKSDTAQLGADTRRGEAPRDVDDGAPLAAADLGDALKMSLPQAAFDGSLGDALRMAIGQ